MYRPVNQKIPILVLLAIVNMSLFYWVSTSRSPSYQLGYQEKVDAAELFQESMNLIKEYQMFLISYRLIYNPYNLVNNIL